MISAQAPAAAATPPGTPLDVTVTTPFGTSAASPADNYAYTPTGALPVVTNLTSSGGSTGGGQTLFIKGANFTDVTGVSFGATAAASFVVVSPTSISVTTPAETAASVDVTVTSSAGVSAVSAADQYAFTVPGAAGSGSSGSGSSSSGSGTGSTGSGTGQSPPPGPPVSYVIVPWQWGQPGGNSAATGSGGLMTSFTPPAAPQVPLLHPVYTESQSGFSMTDSGTVVLPGSDSGGSVNGGTMVMTMTDTVTFSISISISSSSGSFTEHVTREDDMVTVTNFTASDGTGFTRSQHSDQFVTFDENQSNGTQTYTVDTHGTDSSNDHQFGVSSPYATDHADETYASSGTNGSHLDAQISGGVITVNYANNSAGHDSYTDSDTNTTPTSTLDDNLMGTDNWNSDNHGTFNQSASGVITASNSGDSASQGNDLYSDNNTLTSTTVSPDAGGSTTLFETSGAVDKGNDEYSFSGTGNATLNADGTITSSETHDDSDDGQEEVKLTDSGTVDSVETGSDGSLITAHDDFSNSNDDNSDYSDSDNGSDANSTGTDEAKSHSDDKDTFKDSDNVKVVLTSTSPYGAVTTVTITDNPTDGGKTGSQDELDDNETLSGSGSSDDFTFDDSSNENGTAGDIGSIKIVVAGMVGPNDSVDSTETLSLNANGTSTGSTDDPGSEDDTPSRDSEHDTATSDSDVEDQITLNDELTSMETTAAADGSMTQTQVQNEASDTLTADENDNSSDSHTAHSSATSAESDTDHATGDDKSTLTDNSNGESTVTTTITPVTNGTLTTTGTVSSEGSDEFTDSAEETDSADNAGSAGGGSATGSSSDNGTDDQSDQSQLTTDGQQFAMLVLNDPVTGMSTNILVGDISHDIATDDASDDLTDSAGSSGSSETDVAHDRATDNFSDSGPVDITVSGSPQPGTTVNFSTNLTAGSWGSDNVTGEDTSTGSGNDTGDVEFDNAGGVDVAGKVNSNIVTTTNSDDGQGNTVTGSETVTDNTTVGDMANDYDNGEDDFSDTNGTPTDNEHDKDFSTASADTNDKANGQGQSTTVSVDPTTGLKTTIAATDNSTDNETEEQSSSATDNHTSSGATTGDDVTFDNEASDGGTATDKPTIIISAVGTDAAGEQINLQETIKLNGTATGTVSDEDTGEDRSGTGGSSGGDTETVHADLVGHGGITDTIIGSVVTTDPNTGVKTTTTDNVTVTGTDDEHDHEDETDVRSNGGADSDTASQTDSSNVTINSNGTENVTQTNPDGSQAAPPTTTTTTGNDAINASVGLTRAADGTIATIPSGTETGGRSSSDATVGTSSWSNRGLDQTSLTQLASNAAPLTNVADQAGGAGGGGTTTFPAGAPPVTTGGSGNRSTRGLVVPDLAAGKIGSFLKLLKAAKALEDEMISLVEYRQDVVQLFARSGPGMNATRSALLAKANAIGDQLAGLQQQLEGLAKQYYDAGFSELEVTGYPQGLADDASHGLGVGGIGFDAAFAAYKQSLTSIGGQDGLGNADGPLEFVITLGAGKLLKLGVGAAAAAIGAKGGEAALVGGYLARKAPVQVTPGVRVLEGQVVNGLGHIQPWRAHYDKFGRLIARTDFNVANKAAGIPKIHYHIREYNAIFPRGREVPGHFPGEFIP